MSNKGKTLLQHKAMLYDIVVILLSGVHIKDGQIVASDGDSQLKTSEIYQIMHRLKEKFPDVLDFYCSTVTNGRAYSKSLEDVLFLLGAFGITALGGNRYAYTIVKSESKKSITKVLLEKQQDFEKYLPLVVRFNELLNKESISA